MKRLTVEEIKYFPVTSCSRALGKQLAQQVVGELMQYKQTEQELGIDLITLICAIKKWLKYIRIGVDFGEDNCCGTVALLLENKEICILYQTQNYEECKQLEIIKKALTREELEK